MPNSEVYALYKLMWPLEGQARRPPDVPGKIMLAAGITAWHVEIGVVTLLVVATVVVLNRIGSAPRVTSSGQDLGCRGRPGLSQRFRRTEFGTQVAALVEADKRRQLHPRAIWGHIWRLGFPAAFLWLLHTLREHLQQEVRQGGLFDAVAHYASPDVVVHGVLDYALSLVLTFVTLATMTSFISSVASQQESGFRHLLHVSGLSRAAYNFATVGIAGVFQAMLSLGVVLLVSGVALQSRVVRFTSPALLLAEVWLLSMAAVLTGYFLCFASRYASNVSRLGQMIFWTVSFVVPFVIMRPVIPVSGQQSWMAIAVPLIPAYRSMFQLVAGCIKGRCLGLDDLGGTLRSGGVLQPWYMIFGYGTEPQLGTTPPQALCNFVGMVLLQLCVVAAAICFLETRRHPILHSATEGKSPGTQAQAAGLEVRNVTHCYGWLSAAQNTLKDVSFAVAPGSTLGLLGPNGAGKTTVIRCITGEEEALTGTVSLARKDSGAFVGLCPQETVVNYDLTVAENLTFFANLRGKWGPEADVCVQQILFATRLQEKRDCLPDTLSGGMRRRLAVGCSMVATPAVVILDEPTTGLDAVARRGVWDTIQDARAAGTSCLLTTHLMEEAEFLSSHIVVMVQGSVAASGTVQQLKEEWGSGYALRIESELGKEVIARDFLASLLPECSHTPKLGAQPSQMIFNFYGDGEALGHLIIAIHKERTAKGIRHWGVSQATLEETYLQIVQSSSCMPVEA